MEGDVRASAERSALTSKLRRMAGDALEQEQYQSAIFLGNKLVAAGAVSHRMQISLSSDPRDVLLYCTALHRNHEDERALFLLNQYGLLSPSDPNVPAYHLAALCNLQLRRYRDCESLLDPILPEPAPSPSSPSPPSSPLPPPASLDASFAPLLVLRGRVCECQDNPTQSCKWYERALQLDPYCYEAYQSVVQRGLFSMADQSAILRRTGGGGGWMSDWMQLYALPVRSDPEHHALTKKIEGIWGGRNAELLLVKAERSYYQRDYHRSLDYLRLISEIDRYFPQALVLSCACLVTLKRTTELYAQAQALLKSHSGTAVSWYSIGCYYYSLQSFPKARQYFYQSILADRTFSPAWIALGLVYDATEESDQALSTYIAATKCFPGLYVPLLYSAIEYYKTGNLTLAEQLINRCLEMHTGDPLVWNELGIIYYRSGQYERSLSCLTKVLELIKKLPQRLLVHWEATLVNIGHCYRMLGNFPRSEEMFRQAAQINPNVASTHTSLGFVCHLQGKLDDAITAYHRSLALSPGDPLPAQLLARSLDENLERGISSPPPAASSPLEMSDISDISLDDSAAAADADGGGADF